MNISSHVTNRNQLNAHFAMTIDAYVENIMLSILTDQISNSLLTTSISLFISCKLFEKYFCGNDKVRDRIGADEHFTPFKFTSHRVHRNS